MTKPCSKCGSTAPRRTLKSGRLHSHCRTCESIARAERKLLKTTTKAAQILRAQKARLDSDTEALQPGDFAAGALNDGRKDASADKEKKQEYSRSDGEFLQLLRASGGNPAKMPPLDADKNAYYLAVKSEQERRFRNRQLARYEAVHSANESLNLRNLMSMAKEYFTNKTTPAGYALKHVRTDHPRTNIILLSDLHFGADMFIRDNPQAFGAEHESRRFGEVIQQVSGYKSRHRNNARLLVLANGDLVEGMLGHDLRDGAPLTEQLGACLHYLRTAINRWSTDYPSVHVEWQPGNHGRDKMRHPGRATSSKWDGHEWWLGYTLAQMCGNLKNVTFNIPFRAVSSIKLYGEWILQTHGDTEIKLGDPDSKAPDNMRALATWQAAAWEREQRRYTLATFGHFHKYRIFNWQPMSAIFNGCLIPPNGHARTSGYIGERCSQLIWEAVPGHILGHQFPIQVDHCDNDASLNKICTPFRFGDGIKNPGINSSTTDLDKKRES